MSNSRSLLKSAVAEKQRSNLGARIKALRKARGYSNYEQFAYEHEINRSQYGRYENGEDLRFSSLLRVLKALDISRSAELTPKPGGVFWGGV